MTAYSLLKSVINRSIESFGEREKARQFLRTEFCDIVATRMTHQAKCVVPWSHALTSNDGARQVLAYLDEHDKRMNGAAIRYPVM